MPKSQSRFSVLVFLIVGVVCGLAPRTAVAGTPLYQFYKATTGEHFYVLDFTEGVNATFKSEGIGFEVYPSGGADLVPIYRCNAGRHFISLDVNCEVGGASALEQTYGWVHQTQVSGTVPLRRYYRAATSDHFYTADTSEGDAAVARGYVFVQTLGYVPEDTLVFPAGLACDGITDDTAALQSALVSAEGKHLIVPAGSGPCMVSGLSIPNNTHVTVHATLKFLPGQSTALNPDNSRHILNLYWRSKVVIDGTGTLDGNRSQQPGFLAPGAFQAGIGTLYSDTIIIRGLTVKNVRNAPISVVITPGAVIQDVTAFDSGDPMGFAGDTSSCSADGLRIYNMDWPGEAGFAFYGGAHNCALRNSVISNNTYGVQVINDGCQPGANHDIVVENVEVYGNSGLGLHVVSNQPFGNCPLPVTAVNYNVAFQHVRVHGNTVYPYSFENGTNITLTDVDYDGNSTTSKSVIAGNIDGWSPSTVNGRDLLGWTCAVYDPDPVQIVAFVGGNYSFVGWYTANVSSEPAVGGAAACQSGGVAHRFAIHFSPQMMLQWGGQPVSIFTRSPWGFGFPSIAGSGSFTVPMS